MESQRKAAINLMNSWLINSDNFVILDTETTGLDEHDEIVEVAVIDMSGKVLLNTLVNPIQPIPYEATQIHGITNDFEYFSRFFSCRTKVLLNIGYVKEYCCFYNIFIIN